MLEEAQDDIVRIVLALSVQPWARWARAHCSYKCYISAIYTSMLHEL